MNDGPFNPGLSTYGHFGQFRSSSFHYGPFDSVWSHSVYLVQFGALQSILMHLRMEKDVSQSKNKMEKDEFELKLPILNLNLLRNIDDKM